MAGPAEAARTALSAERLGQQSLRDRLNSRRYVRHLAARTQWPRNQRLPMKKGPCFAARAESTNWVVEETDFSVTDLLRRNSAWCRKDIFSAGNNARPKSTAKIQPRATTQQKSTAKPFWLHRPSQGRQLGGPALFGSTDAPAAMRAVRMSVLRANGCHGDPRSPWRVCMQRSGRRLHAPGVSSGVFAVVTIGFKSARKLSMTMVLKPCMLSVGLTSRCRYRPSRVVELLPLPSGSRPVRPALVRAAFVDVATYR